MVFKNLKSRSFKYFLYFWVLLINACSKDIIIISSLHGSITENLTYLLQVTSGMSPAFNLYGCTLIGKSEFMVLCNYNKYCCISFDFPL